MFGLTRCVGPRESLLKSYIEERLKYSHILKNITYVQQSSTNALHHVEACSSRACKRRDDISTYMGDVNEIEIVLVIMS